VTPLHIGGVVPSLAVTAGHLPQRTEAGIGALMPWADRLWALSYVSHLKTSGSGTGLYEIFPDLTMRRRPESVVGTYASRLIHPHSSRLLIGPHVVDTEGHVSTIPDLVDHRLAATMEHLEDPAGKAYYLTMGGPFFEVDLDTLAARQLFDLREALQLPSGINAHFKGGHTAQGRVVVGNNAYDERDWAGTHHPHNAGALAEWRGDPAGGWTVLERTAFMEVAGRRNMGQVIFATGWDRVSAILKVRTAGREGTGAGHWDTYRLPKASHTFDYWWQTEWTRIREVETERYLMDCHGMFYELSPVAYGDRVWGLRPVCAHLRVIPDYCSFRGLLVLAGNQVSPNRDMELHQGQPQAGLWFGKSDDLWSFGKPKGWGGVWWNAQVAAGQPSDPYLMTGFDHKVLHLTADGAGHAAGEPLGVRVEVDFLGWGEWRLYDTLRVPAGGYLHHEFPTGFSAHWIRLVPEADCRATAYFHYT
jgi:hypothetical protein